MQTYLTSPTCSFSHRRNASGVRGFTLIELLICCAIIGIVSAIVLLKYSSFDSTVLLKGQAYEIALSLREAQVKSVSAVGTGVSTFKYPYGMTFSVESGKTQMYTVFRFASPTVYPYYDTSEASPKASDISTYTIPRTMRVSEICYTEGTNPEICSSSDTALKRLDISFRRPEFKALFFAEKGSADVSSTITSGKIKVNSTNNTANVFVIEISQFGQISVYKE